MKRKSIVIFTNKGSLGRLMPLDATRCKRIKLENIFGEGAGEKLADDKAYRFDKGVLIEAKSCKEKGIYILPDTMSRENFEAFTHGIEQENLHILYHLNGGSFSEDILANYPNKFKGEHTSTPRSGYNQFLEKIYELGNRTYSPKDIEHIIEHTWGISSVKGAIDEFFLNALLQDPHVEDVKTLGEALSLDNETKTAIQRLVVTYRENKAYCTRVRDLLRTKGFIN